ncbi:MAG: hypothetical protein LBV23_07830 [Deltaproteobacteria bacterium]|jgi:hypothetical protein|nr:hypothetical protein [Deltaproteobacteria bacterium]
MKNQSSKNIGKVVNNINSRNNINANQELIDIISSILKMSMCPTLVNRIVGVFLLACGLHFASAATVAHLSERTTRKIKKLIVA